MTLKLVVSNVNQPCGHPWTQYLSAWKVCVQCEINRAKKENDDDNDE